MDAKKKLSALIAFFLVSSVLFSGCAAYSSSESSYSNVGCKLSDEWNSSWISMTLLVIMTIYTFLGLVYMGSVLFKKPEWLVWAKDEFYQGLITLLLVGSLGWFVATSCDVVFSLTGSTQDPFTIADIYLNELLWQKTLQTATGLYMNSFFLQLLAANSTPIGMYKSQIRFFYGLNGLAQVYDFLFMIISASFASLMIQMIWLKLIQGLAFKVVLPLGILFRAVPFLRQAGATFIALAIGFYLLYPMLYVMDKMVVDAMEDEGMFDDADWRDYSGSDPVAFGGPLERLGSVVGAIQPVDNVNQVAALLPQALFLPTLNMLITLAFVKSALKMLSQNFASMFE